MLIAALYGAVALGAPRAGTELVLVIDNSCSMIERHNTANGPHPPADPDRTAVLGAQIVWALTEGTRDHLTVLAFGPQRWSPSIQIGSADEVRQLPHAYGTVFLPPLTRAREILTESELTDRMLLVLSDGAPTDYDEPLRARQVLGFDEPDAIDAFHTVVLGLFDKPEPRAEEFLTAMARSPSDYERVEDASQVVTRFTQSYARASGARAYTGLIEPGGELTLTVGDHVHEVLAVAATRDRSGPFSASLRADGRVIPQKSAGDNGCSHPTTKNPAYCDDPRMHFRVWRTAHRGGGPGVYTLQVPEAGGDIGYGVILRTDLVARLDPTETARFDTPSPVRARLELDGETFTDAAFFAADGFRAEARIGGQLVPMQHIGDGIFEGQWTPPDSRPAHAIVQFSNSWMAKTASATLQVIKPDPLELTGPEVLDLGRWRGGRWRTSACADLSVHANHRYDPASVAITFEGVPEGLALSLDPDPGGAVGRWQACAFAEGCCGDLAPGPTAILIQASDPDGSVGTVRVPVDFRVDRTGFLRCWWPWILTAIVLALLVWFILGWIRPHDFDADLTVRVAGSERQLSRAAALVLREQPRGRRGFYRNARIALTHAGDFVAQTRNAAVWVEATGASETRIHLQGPLEVRDRRTRQWVPVDAEVAADGVRTNVVYRLGDIYLRFQ